MVYFRNFKQRSRNILFDRHLLLFHHRHVSWYNANYQQRQVVLLYVTAHGRPLIDLVLES